MLIGLHGRKQAGKDTVYYRLALQQRYKRQVERRSFADLLYQSAAAALGLTVEELQAYKTEPAVVLMLGDFRPGGGTSRRLCDVREYLQRYGTEAHREVFREDFWTRQVDLEHKGEVVVVTDVRFPNEAQRIHEAGGMVVRVIGPTDVEAAGDSHASEAPLPDELIDCTLYNTKRDDGYADLDARVRALHEAAYWRQWRAE